MNPTLSIIIPAYNVVSYLDACLQSVVAQSLADNQYEIIVVDDGSTDGTSALADEWSNRLTNLVVLHQPNQGLSVARNNGIQCATGQYILFLDADDTLAPRSLQHPIQLAICHQLDVLRFQYGVFDESGKKIQNSLTWGQRETLMDGKSYLALQKKFRAYVWTYLIRRTLITQTNPPLWFEPGVSYEDVRWTPILLWHAERVMICDNQVYQYKLRKGSITHAIELKKIQININEQFMAVERLQQLKREYQSWVIFDRQIWNMCESILTTSAKRDYAHRNMYIQRLKPILNATHYDPHLFDMIDCIKNGIIRLSAPLYCFLRHYC